MAEVPVLIRRRDAAQATLDRFEGRAFAWSTNDCVRMAAFHVRKMGHKTPPLPKVGSYKDPKGALRALQRVTGLTRIEHVLELRMGFAPIPYAFALTGDLVAIKSDDPDVWPSIALVLDNGRVLAFVDDGETVTARVASPKPESILGAWKVEPA